MQPNIKIAVLLAAYNGIQSLEEQVNSILAQKDVDVSLFVSVDQSNDGTEGYFDQLASFDTRVKVLPHGHHFGSAGPNFYRLIKEVDFESFDYVAFSDQDDIWFPDKLVRAHKMIKESNADAYSSNVIAFWENGLETLIVKSQPQRRFDYLFEAAGPGCTYVMKTWVLTKVRDQLININSSASKVTLHDWLTFAICRSSGGRWIIDSSPGMRYRQHQNNQVGVNQGFKAIWKRLLKLRAGWYRNEVIKITQICVAISNDPKTTIIYNLLISKSYLANLKLLFMVNNFRRSLSDRISLGLFLIFGIF